MSSTTTSYSCASDIQSASSPRPATSAARPSRRSPRRIRLAIRCSSSTISTRIDYILASFALVRHAHELEALVAAGDHFFLHLTEAGDVVLLLKLRFDGAPLDRRERLAERPRRNVQAREEPAHAGRAGGVGRVVILPVDGAGSRPTAHDHARLGAVDTRLPRIACTHETAVLQLERVLAHVPDIPLLVLRIPVERPLERLSALRDGVAYDGASHAEDVLDLMRHDHVVRLCDAVADAAIVEGRPGLE